MHFAHAHTSLLPPSSSPSSPSLSAPKMKFAALSLLLLPFASSLSAPASARKPYTFTKSDAIFKEAQEIMPGGVSSPVRAFRSVGGNPVVFDHVKGSKAWDVDGNEFIDYVGTWGPAILGHADDEVLSAIKETMDKGTSFGAPCALENELAKMVIDAVPSVEVRGGRRERVEEVRVVLSNPHIG